MPYEGVTDPWGKQPQLRETPRRHRSLSDDSYGGGSMKLAFRVLLFLGWGLIPAPASSAPPSSNEYHIVLPRRAIAAGERVALHLVPPAPAGVRVPGGYTPGVWESVFSPMRPI